MDFCLLQDHFEGSAPRFTAVVGFSFGLIPVSHGMSLGPENAAERTRALRRSGVQLQADRIVRQQTRDRRQVLLQHFDAWLTEQIRTTFEELIRGPHCDAEYVSETLVAYGKDMYNSGKA